ncbi:DUF1906 domain-containing protein [Paenibacillus albicereus]|uniref:DUF1906 domain-containing protein n=1 Tax=Paenibacillus albicereus TaxID=2726185 RepID=A0A6H2H015_9BACL|nr:DUF1906 domain-containing protein [Paenibacillus albicereus]QJC52698.1 DUF1906 domain-containing protein [Paenibacillus albicereus]
MAKGIDTAVNCHSLAKAIREAGYEFVGRYYNRNRPQKNLTREEAAALSTEGLYIVAVWENGFPTSASYFSAEAGRRDGADAAAYARKAIGQPGGTPIYFTVDYDASDADLNGPVRDYIRGVIESVQAEGAEAARKGGKPYAVGIYGSGLTCGRIRAEHPQVAYAWLAESRGWRGHEAFAGWSLRQLQSTTVCGISVDTNESSGDGGGFRIASPNG